MARSTTQQGKGLARTIEELGAFDDNEAGWKVDAPGEGRSAHQHLDATIHEEFLHGGPVVVVQPRMVDADAVDQCVPQRLQTVRGPRRHTHIELVRAQ